MKIFKLILMALLLVFVSGMVLGATSDYVYILKVDSTSTYPTTIYPSSEISLNITLENISELSDAQNIDVTLYLNEQYFEAIKSTDALEIIKFSQSGTTSLRFKVKDSAPGGYYTIPFKVEYVKNGQDFVIDTQISISVNDYDKINVILTDYPKDKLYLDEQIEIKGIVKNEGNATLKGISIESQYSTDERLIPLDEVTKFIGDIRPGSEKAFSFNFIIPKTAEIGVYDMNIVATDISSNSDNEKIAFIVEDHPTLIISSIDKSIDSGKTYLRQNDYFI